MVSACRVASTAKLSSTPASPRPTTDRLGDGARGTVALLSTDMQPPAGPGPAVPPAAHPLGCGPGRPRHTTVDGVDHVGPCGRPGYGRGVDALSYEPLTPVSFLDRAAAAHGDRIGVVDGTSRWTYAELHDRSRRLAGALAERAAGRPVAVLAPNTHVLLEANFGVPWAGVPLVAVNTRLSAGEVRYILEHSEAAVLVHDRDFDELVEAATRQLPIQR